MIGYPYPDMRTGQSCILLSAMVDHGTAEGWYSLVEHHPKDVEDFLAEIREYVKAAVTDFVNQKIESKAEESADVPLADASIEPGSSSSCFCKNCRARDQRHGLVRQAELLRTYFQRPNDPGKKLKSLP